MAPEDEVQRRIKTIPGQAGLVGWNSGLLVTMLSSILLALTGSVALAASTPVKRAQPQGIDG